MSAKLHHHCRRERCNAKLEHPTDNARHAFCRPFCRGAFYRTRCRVCERDLRKPGKRGTTNRRYCRPPNKCKQEAENCPSKYADGPLYGLTANNEKNAFICDTLQTEKGTASVAMDWQRDGARNCLAQTARRERVLRTETDAGG